MDDSSSTTSTVSELLLGTIGAGGRARVDRRGVISPESGRWTFDWWVGAADRWHIASEGALVRQSLIDATPVVLSAMRVPGGEMEQRSWAAVDGATGRPVIVVEFHNATTVPVVLALAVTARSEEAEAPVIDFVEGVVSIDGEGVARFAREPSRFGLEDATRSALEITTAGDAATRFPAGGVRSDSPSTVVSFIFPVPHTATLRVVLPLDSESEGRASIEDCRRIVPSALPPADRVAAGWRAQLARSPRFDLPERRIEEAVDGARAHLLVHAAGDDPLRFPGEPVDGVERSEMASALAEQGLSAEAKRLLVAATDLQNSDGSFDADRLDATASWIVAVDGYVALAGDDEFADECAVRVASAVHWLSKRQRGRRLQRSSAFFGLGAGPSWIAARERPSYDARWSLRAYRSAIRVLERADQAEAGELVESHLAALQSAMAAMGVSHEGVGDGARDPHAIARLREELLEGEPLWSWPGAQDAHDPARTAAFLRNVRSIVVDDSTNVDLLPGFGEEWLGQPVALLRLPTCGGVVSFALRWHGARPALLWEVEGDRDFTLTCRSIDPDWSSSQSRGEALLSAPVFDHDHLHHLDRDGGHDHNHDDLGGSRDQPVAVESDDGAGGSFT